MPAKCFLQRDAFDGTRVPLGAARVCGHLKNFNTEEDFRAFLGDAAARESSLSEALQGIREDILSGLALSEPWRLRRGLEKRSRGAFEAGACSCAASRT